VGTSTQRPLPPAEAEGGACAACSTPIREPSGWPAGGSRAWGSSGWP